jgi:hypothetical protein
MHASGKKDGISVYQGSGGRDAYQRMHLEGRAYWILNERDAHQQTLGLSIEIYIDIIAIVAW